MRIRMLGIAFLGCILGAGLSPAADGPLAAWHFDEGQGGKAADAVGQGHDAVLAGHTPPKWVDGFLGKALEFGQAGKACCTVENSKEMNPAAFTIEAWVLTRKVLKAGQQEILTKTADSREAGGFRLRNNYRALELRLADGKAYVSCWDEMKTRLPEDTWAHVAGTFDGKTARIYINAVLMKEVPAPNGYKPTPNPITIGAGPNGAYYWFDGVIDEVYFYGRARSQEEIFQSMAQQIKQHNEQEARKEGA